MRADDEAPLSKGTPAPEDAPGAAEAQERAGVPPLELAPDADPEGRAAESSAPGERTRLTEEPSALAELEREQMTARQGLTKERQDALDRQARMAGWFMLFGVGPAALVAIILALVTDRPDLVWPFLGLGIGVQLWRIWQEQRRIQQIEKELEDPIDGS